MWTWHRWAGHRAAFRQWRQPQRGRWLWRLGSGSANVALIGVMLGLFGAGNTVVGLIVLVLELMAFVAWRSKARGMSPKWRASVSDFPPVQELLDEGWLFGEKPPDV